MTLAASASTGARPDVDPQLLAMIGDASAPGHFRGRVQPPQSLPGTVGLREVMRTFIGGIRHGADFYVAERARKGDLYRGLGLDLPTVFVWDPETVQAIFRNEDGGWSTGLGWDALMLSRVSPREGNSGWLLAMDFDAHRHARKLVQPAFLPKAIKGYLDIAGPAIERALQRWLTHGKLAFKPAVRALLADVANEIFTGFSDPDERVAVDRALTQTWQGMLSPTGSPFMNPIVQRARRGCAFLHAQLLAQMPQRRQQPGRDLLSQLSLAGASSGEDDHALADVLMTVMFGAYDTTSLAVASMAYLLAKYPAWQDRLRDEARSVDAHDWGGLQRLEWMELAWKETLRLMPVAGFSPRRALRDVTLGGHRLRAGTFVGLMNGPIGRCPQAFAEPLKFDPERFARGQRQLHLPFGSGPHACIGMQLASIEAKMLFHGLLTRSRFTLERDVGLAHAYNPLGTVQGKVELRVTPI